MAKRKQGYNAREDESLGMRIGPERDKTQSMRDRRYESYGDWGKRSKGYTTGGEVDIEDISSEEWFKKETTPVYRNINKWVDETPTPDAKIVKKIGKPMPKMKKKK